MSCEFCKVDRDDMYLLNLPCGYLVCYEHIKSLTVTSSCFMCQEHSLNQKSCSKMKKNRVKLEKIKNLKLKNLVIESCNQVDALKNDHQTDLRSHFSNIINQIDLKRELLKNQFNNLIDDYYMSLFDQVTAMESEFSKNTKLKLNELNTDEIRERLNNFTDLELTEDELAKINFEILSNLYEDKLKKFFDFFKEYKKIKFCEGSNKIDTNAWKLFGSISTNLLSTTKSSQLEKTLGEEDIPKNNLVISKELLEDVNCMAMVNQEPKKSVFDSNNETVNDVDESSWSKNSSVIDNTAMHSMNETVNDVDESSWSRNSSVIDNTAMHPKNETVNDVDESSWSRNSSVIDNTAIHPKNETVNDVDDSFWSRNNSIIDSSTLEPNSI